MKTKAIFDNREHDAAYRAETARSATALRTHARVSHEVTPGQAKSTRLHMAVAMIETDQPGGVRSILRFARKWRRKHGRTVGEIVEPAC